MEYFANQKRFVEIIDVIKVGDTYQAKDSEEKFSNERRSYPAKKVRYDRRAAAYFNNQYINSINIKI